VFNATQFWQSVWTLCLIGAQLWVQSAKPNSMSWKEFCCKAGVILLEDYAVLLDYLGLLYTRSQGRCSTQIKHSYWCKSWIWPQGLYIRIKAEIEKIFSICPKLLISAELCILVLTPRLKKGYHLRSQIATLGAHVPAFSNILTSML
jgi:hypothetical protein